MAKRQLDSILANLVEERVEAALAPHVVALHRVSQLLGLRRGPGRPPKALARAITLGRRPVRREKAAKGDASKFAAGQSVHYRQGRGQFLAKVLKVDTAANTVTLQRESDGKKVVRPAGKIYS